MAHKTIKVNYLARVEGEGGLRVVVRDGKVVSAELNIFEPPRFFEALLRRRAFTEAPDITARICGICPVAYQMSAVHAMENALGVTVTGPIRDLRRLIYCGEWIESHVLHIYMLHAPDFLGYEGAIDATMAMWCGSVWRSRRPATKSPHCSAGARFIRSTSAWAASTARRANVSWCRSPSGSKGRAMPRSRPCDGRRASTSRIASGTTPSWHCVMRPNIRSTKVASFRTAGSTLRLPNTTTISRRVMSNARPRCIRAFAAATHISPGRWRATT
jgi:hypothetical protein